MSPSSRKQICPVSCKWSHSSDPAKTIVSETLIPSSWQERRCFQDGSIPLVAFTVPTLAHLPRRRERLHTGITSPFVSKNKAGYNIYQQSPATVAIDS